MPGEIWLGYAGSLSASYDLPLVFDALREINNPHLRFVVMGNGPLRKQFEDDSEGINVTFAGRLPYEQMCGALAACDIVVNPIVDRSVAGIINKHADYAACGKPVLNTQKSEEYRRLIDEYQMGFNCEDGYEIADKLKNLIADDSYRKAMGSAGRMCAEERFDRGYQYKSLVDVVLSQSTEG